ncbi:MAG: carbonic anhydrase [Candidatus Omnitrophota bacterium]
MIEKFAAAINCIDGRVQKPVIEFMQKSFCVDHVDMITEPGPNKILAEGVDINVIESLKKKVGVSVENHNARIIAVVAHYGCAGNPESEDAQKEHLRKAVSVVASWGFPVKKIIALWLDENFKPNIIS